MKNLIRRNNRTHIRRIPWVAIKPISSPHMPGGVWHLRCQYIGSKLSYVSEVGPGPGFFPFWIGIGLLVFSCYQMILSLRRRGSQTDSRAPLGAAPAAPSPAGLRWRCRLFFSLDRFRPELCLLTIFLSSYRIAVRLARRWYWRRPCSGFLYCSSNSLSEFPYRRALGISESS